MVRATGEGCSGGPAEPARGGRRARAQPRVQRSGCGAIVRAEWRVWWIDLHVPQRSPRRSSAELIERVERLRRERWTGVRIAQATGLSRATVSRILTRLKLNKAKMLEPQVPIVRYEHAAPGDLLHLDIKKFARIVKAGHRITGDPRDETRGAGWEFLYVAVDDHSRIAYTALYPDETRPVFGQLPRRSRRLLPTLRHRHPPRAHRQWPLLLCPSLRSRLPRSRHRPQAHPHLHPTHQRQGRTLHPTRSASGRTPADMKTQNNEPLNSSPGPTSTTGTVPTPASTKTHPSAVPASMSTTS